MPEICVSSDEELKDDYFEYVIVFFVVLDLLGILVMAVLIILETRTKMHYHRIKDRPAKLVLTREYLEKLRPPRKAAQVNTLPSFDSKQTQGNESAVKKDEPPKAT
uniref:Uncharacterized protein n=1 Tax=Panagrellus redivivus TaxID=6233 RepID=A0A7E4WAB7_PANRE